MYKAVFTDMDGTLLQKNHSISSPTQKIIRELTERGILIVPISARPLHGMLHITQPVFPDDVPVVSLNGSYIYHKGKIIFEINVTAAEAASIHAVVQNHPVSPMYYSSMHWYAGTLTPAVKKEQKITPVEVTVQDFGTTLQLWQQHDAGPHKILIAGEEPLILDMEQQMLAQFGNSLNIYKSQPRYLELMHKDASKTNAIQLLMQMYGLKQEEIVAIGDNYNDKGMIEFAALGVAMGNAPDDIKKAADFVTDTNDNDGVANALQQIFL